MTLRILLICFLSIPALGYVGGAPRLSQGDVEVTLRSEFMRGLAGPENLPESQQKQKPSVNIFEFGAGYSLGTLSDLLQDVKVRFTAARFTSAAEILNGTVVYPEDQGWLAGLEVSSNFVHEPDRLFGTFIRVQHPVDVDIGKFVNPKLDRVGLGVQSAFKLSDRFAQETLLFWGSGISQSGFKQNSSLSLSLLGAMVFSEGFLKLGPFFDADLSERNDSAYGTTGVRSFRVGLVTALGYQLSREMGLEFSYVQKFSGAYFRATKDFVLGLRCVF